MKKYILLGFLCFIAACAGTSRPSSFYTLRAERGPQTVVSSSAKISIGVANVSIPAYLDKPQIVTSAANGVEQEISEFNRWSEPLSSMLQRVIADDLSANLPKALVKPRASARENFDYLLTVEINRFDGSFDQTVQLDAWWALVNKKNDVLIRRRLELSKPVGDSYDDLVVAQSALIAEFTRHIAEEIKKLKK